MSNLQIISLRLAIAYRSCVYEQRIFMGCLLTHLGRFLHWLWILAYRLCCRTVCVIYDGRRQLHQRSVTSLSPHVSMPLHILLPVHVTIMSLLTLIVSTGSQARSHQLRTSS
ncbi:uncharacterized protein K460DRAFT_58285 [Cucurbitaria berberidis CBS 394.84]|uniref:Uncharacterized protein n=1 Tax=Cucurbitaria berberidis CBS 394.84 TaxID=1168544 RepID=A0A9P4LAF6_9PLEO|nr:uncharacterized protein K460DRAFT_58285 [Cucurbitaria berberidis CBS 394.84]KAF1847433.1 hypothetical protein K460DRAFT_58285 [Cucurbitaria berberidis CBS 394.84]